MDACWKQLSPISSWKLVKVDRPFISSDLPVVHHSLHVLSGNSFSAIPKQTHLLLAKLCCLILMLTVSNYSQDHHAYGA